MCDHRIVSHLAVVVAVSLALIAPALPAQDTDILFGPEVFVRQAGRPTIESRVIDSTGFQSPFTLYVLNGGENGNYRISSAKIWLDGQLLLGPSDFSQQVEGHVLPVTLTELSVLQIRLASSPSSYLTVWIEGEAIQESQDLEVILDELNAVSEWISSEDGGDLTAFSVDRTMFNLEIPPGALPESQQITMTPILSIQNLPMSGGFRFGVELEPGGIELLLPAVLTISPVEAPSPQPLIGFHYIGTGDSLHLVPISVANDVITLFPNSFSGFGIGDGSEDDVSSISAEIPSTAVAQYEQQIAAIMFAAGGNTNNLTSQQWDSLQLIFNHWLANVVSPALDRALAATRDGCGAGGTMSEFVRERAPWLGTMQLLGLDSDWRMQNMVQALDTAVEQETNELFEDLDTECSQENLDFCSKLDLYDCIRDMASSLQLYVHHVPDISEMCDGIDLKRVNGVQVDPTNVLVCEFYREDVNATVRNVFGQTLAGPTAGSGSLAQDFGIQEISWRSSAPGIAAARAPDALLPLAGEVFGVLTGEAQGTVNVNQCGTEVAQSFPITVRCPVESVEMNFSRLFLEVGDSFELEATLRGCDGNAYLVGDYLPTWTVAPPSGVVHLDSEFRWLDGRHLGTVVAGDLGQATVSVSVCPEPPHATASTDITVGVCPVESLDISPVSPRLHVGGQTTVHMVPRDQNGEVIEILGEAPVWSLDSDEVITLTPGELPDGTFTAILEGLRPGTETVRVSVCGELGAAYVNVVPDYFVSWNVRTPLVQPDDAACWESDTGDWVYWAEWYYEVQTAYHAVFQGGFSVAQVPGQWQVIPYGSLGSGQFSKYRDMLRETDYGDWYESQESWEWGSSTASCEGHDAGDPSGWVNVELSGQSVTVSMDLNKCDMDFVHEWWTHEDLSDTPGWIEDSGSGTVPSLEDEFPPVSQIPLVLALGSDPSVELQTVTMASSECCGQSWPSCCCDPSWSLVASWEMTASPWLVVNTTGAGGGVVTSSPSGDFCGGSISDCAMVFPLGEVVTLTATPDSESFFGGWSGHPDCSDGVVLAEARKSCTARFDPLP